jgi:hypothetical protein
MKILGMLDSRQFCNLGPVKIQETGAPQYLEAFIRSCPAYYKLQEITLIDGWKGTYCLRDAGRIWIIGITGGQSRGLEEHQLRRCLIWNRANLAEALVHASSGIEGTLTRETHEPGLGIGRRGLAIGAAIADTDRLILCCYTGYGIGYGIGIGQTWKTKPVYGLGQGNYITLETLETQWSRNDAKILVERCKRADQGDLRLSMN